MPPYEYRCVDRSILVEPYRRWWVPLFTRWVPLWMPANALTLGASACMWALLGLAAAGPPAPVLGLASVVPVHAYLVYDHADGMQAKRTGTSSALGEYLDHALDAYHGPIIVLTFFALVGAGPRLAVLLSVWCIQVAFAATLTEQRLLGVLQLGRLGALEGTLLFSAVFATFLIPGARQLWQAPVIGGLPLYGGVVVAGAVATLGTVLGCVWRLRRLPLQLATLLIGCGVLAVALARGPLPLWMAIACQLMYCGDETGRVLGSHLLGRRLPWPDPIAPVGATLIPLFPHPWLGIFLLAFVSVRAGGGAATVLVPLRSQWRWINPPLAAS